VQNHVNLVGLVKSFSTIYIYVLAKFSFDTAENEPFEVCWYLHLPACVMNTARSAADLLLALRILRGFREGGRLGSRRLLRGHLGENAFFENAFFEHAFFENAFVEHAFFENAFFENAFFENA